MPGFDGFFGINTLPNGWQAIPSIRYRSKKRCTAAEGSGEETARATSTSPHVNRIVHEHRTKVH